MKQLLTKSILILTIMVGLFSCNISHNQIATSEFLHYQQTRKIHNLVIDTRSSEEFNKSHYSKAINISFPDVEFKEKVKAELPKNVTDTWILFVFAQDAKSTILLEKNLKQIYKRHKFFKGPTGIFYIEGGFEAWEKEEE